MRVKWEDVLKALDETLKYFENQNVKPTLRTLFYRLVSQQQIPNTSSYYNQLSSRLVQARKEGRYKWDCIEDRVRLTTGELYDWSPSESQVEKIKAILIQKLEDLNLDNLLKKHFRTFPTELASFEVSRWAKQPIGCVIWLEKEALVSTIKNWTKDLDVPIGFNRGYDSWTNIYSHVQDLNHILDRGHEKVVIFYLGDLDPSGVDMDRHLKEALKFFGLNQEQTEFRRLALTSEQVEKYGLPPRPEDAETLAKLQRDPRTKNYDGKYIVELDALFAYAFEDFRNEIIDAVNSVWDKGIYDVLKKEAESLGGEVENVIDETVEKAKEKLGRRYF
jgi:hypothetical protein